MKHEIPLAQLGPLGEPMAEAVQACVHCGFCLPTCPTYQVLGQESDSPRGRILLMKETLEGKLELDQASPHIDRCLGCLACETACPSGVKYGELISPFRAVTDSQRKRSMMDRLKRKLVFSSLPYPGRFRWAMRLGGLGRRLRPLVPGPLRPMVDLVPHSLPKAVRLPERVRPEGPVRARVALLAGCAQQVLRPSINQATIAVLLRNGVEVLIPKAQGCCGALAWHVGDRPLAAKLARHNLAAFPHDVDAIVTNAAGCGSGLHDYPTILRGEPEAEAAQAFADRVVDISVFLDRLGIEPPPPLEQPLRVAMHDACHLGHAQQVRAQPRRLLQQIAGLELRELNDQGLCCGSAGTYNLDQPEIAAELGKRKAQRVLDTGCEMVVTGNIGCLIQLQQHLPPSIRVRHTIELLAESMGELEIEN